MGELSCKRAELMIEELLEDRLDEPDRTALDDHLLRCESCQGYRNAAMIALDVLGDQPLVSPSERALDRIWRDLDRRLDQDESGSAESSRSVGANGAPARVVPMRLVGVSVAIAAALAAVAFGIFWAWSPLSRDETVARDDTSRRGPALVAESPPEQAAPVEAQEPRDVSGLALAQGSAEVSRDGAQVQVSPDLPILGGDEVQTADDGVAVLRRDDEVTLALGPGTTLGVDRVSTGSVEVSLSSGWLAGRVDHGDEPLEVRVETPAGELHVLGTIFAVEVTSADAVTVRVSRGEVAFETHEGQGRVTVAAGHEAVFPEARTTETSQQVVRRDEALLNGRLEAPSEAVATASVEELFERAEAARRGGRHAQAASLYRRIAASDNSSAGGTALISLGQLSLGPLGQPAQARRAFSSYLSSGRRALRQEAFVGLLRSQRALGQSAAARATARRYLEQYPNGRYRSVAEELGR